MSPRPRNPGSAKSQQPRELLIAALQERCNFSGEVAREAIAALIDIIGEHLERGEKVSLAPIGILRVVRHKKRPARNPNTGEEVMIPARRVVKWSSCKAMKERMGS